MDYPDPGAIPSQELFGASPVELMQSYHTSEDGLSIEEAEKRLTFYGPNVVASEQPPGPLRRFFQNVKNPLVILLLILAIVSLLTGDKRAAIVIMVMVVLGVVLRYIQESRATNAAESLKSLVRTHATVIRKGKESEVPIDRLVPGDIVKLAAGDMVPADLKLLSAKDLFISQSTLTGESMPVERKIGEVKKDVTILEREDACFMGTNVVSGTGHALVLATGKDTFLGGLAERVTERGEDSAFDKGVNGFTWLMIRLILVLVPLVFFINGLGKHNWVEAFLFALAVAVGLTPEMLPMIVTVNLSKGALQMAKKKVIVKRLNAIQNIGAMDVLCTDKTGTITEGRIILEKHVDLMGRPSEKVLSFGYLNSFYQTGMRNLMDDAVLEHGELELHLGANNQFRKIDEIPFDFVRKRMSVIVEDTSGLNWLICKGAVEGVLSICSFVEVEGEVKALSPDLKQQSDTLMKALSEEGFRVVAIAYKKMPGATDEPVYKAVEESGLVLLGFLSFLDPPKQTAREGLEQLSKLKVNVKVLTGDNELVTTYICSRVGISVQGLVLGADIEAMTDTQLDECVERTNIFAKLVPMHKERIIKALQRNGHVTGFMGDGINDAPALKAADVGISVDGAVDIAKESSDIILLENNLLVLQQGVLEGRRVFGNIVKYIKMAASSNFGNMLSVVGASVFLPFLPMLPIQVLTNNLLYDFSQAAIPTDDVDQDWLTEPRKWSLHAIGRFIFYFGPISSLFDYITFFILMHVFNAGRNPELFHTGWFIESLITQSLIIHVIRTDKIPFVQSRASWPLILSTLIIIVVGIWLIHSPLAAFLGFVSLPFAYWGYMVAVVAGYFIFTQLVKTWILKASS
ncbi:magnesium-translocating P-type ATPase [Flavihumibacter rivuli]|uniref:magnesium-translocating P-type ATPase n=1 Tax=Flavihumibacter rivuli TaxID=2838156 RepID=UPI001BDE4831|nr:magnesium-translocating P-type ATPase [Flavihumibacter rivuli]ULQ56711.1 magnesium-translocating P-type ATPase [Flavihumibacter rivuli]